MNNAFMLNWRKNVIYDVILFIVFYINEVLRHEIKYLIMED
jgi:hypothetical protein